LTFVLDSSVCLAWCFEDEATPAVSALLDRLETESAVAPPLLRYETGNVLVLAERKGRITARRRDDLLEMLRALPIVFDRVAEANAWTAAVALAAAQRLTVYDAAYLELAQRLHLPLATLDAALGRAAEASGIAVLP
jgi:predicted nucleic acid-binding protein